MKFIRAIYGSILPLLAAPLISFAQFRNGGISRVGGSGGGFYALLDVGYKLIGYFQVIIFFVALVYLLRGAFLFTQGKEKEASPMILNAVIGIVVALLAFAVIPLICSVTGAGGEACTVGR